MTYGAIIDPSGQYRYLLLRAWGECSPKGRRYVTFVMLNPSTADATEDDPTIRRCIQFAKDWGYDGVLVVNLFAHRSTNPDALLSEVDPVGPENDYYISLALRQSALVVCAWGSHRAVKQRPARRKHVVDLVRLFKHDPMTLKLSKGGEPYHPLYLRSDARPFPLEKK